MNQSGKIFIFDHTNKKKIPLKGKGKKREERKSESEK